MASSLTVDRADVQASGAANALQSLPGFFVRENFRAAIVEQDNVEFFGAVVGRNARPDGGVRVHALAGRGAGKQLQKDFKVGKFWDDFFDADEADEDLRQGEAHASIAFGLDHADGAGFGDGEVCAADADFYAQEFFAEVAAGGLGEVFRFFAEGLQLHFFKK